MGKKTIREKIYDLLYAYPMTDYEQKQGYLNVLIIGDNEIVWEAFKAVFWCGQLYGDNTLAITIAEDKSTIQERIINEMPGLTEKFRSYATIKFVQSGQIPIGFDYVINTSENETHHDNGTFCTTFIGEGFDKVIDDEANDLARIAKNIHLSYAMQSNERISFKKELAANYNDVFDKGTNKVIGNSYNRQSSLAAALHTKYKLALCSSLETFIQAVNERNDLYNQLCHLEHRRWNAYMISEGWRCPSEKDLLTYAFTNNNDHRLKSRKLHPCICEGPKNSWYLKEHKNLWAEPDRYQNKELSELDRLSLLLHDDLVEKCEISKIENEIVQKLAFIKRVLPDVEHKEGKNALLNYRSAVIKVLQDQSNSELLYKTAVEDIYAHSVDCCSNALITNEIHLSVNDVEASLRLVFLRNSRRDFALEDANLIDMLPFCCWYGKQYKTVITVSNGKPADDVAVPTMLIAQEAIFLTEDTSRYYESVINKYFIDRGGNTSSIIFNTALTSVSAIVSAISIAIGDRKDIVLNCLDYSDTETVLAIGMIAKERNIPIVQYDKKKGVVNFETGMPVSRGLLRKSWTIKEFVNLNDGTYSNPYKFISTKEKFDLLFPIFRDFNIDIKYRTVGKDGKVGVKVHSFWPGIDKFFTSSSKNIHPSLNRDNGNRSVISFVDFFDKEVFDNCNIRIFLSCLEKYYIIVRYKLAEEASHFRVEFNYMQADEKLISILREFSINNYKPKEHIGEELIFTTQNILSRSTISPNDVTLFFETDHFEITKAKQEFISRLEQSGIISDWKFDSEKYKGAFTFCSKDYKSMFQTQGKIFEGILYYKIKQLGIFDDVQTGTEFTWENNKPNFESLMLERLNKSKQFGCANYFTQQKIVRDLLRQGKLSTATYNELDVVMTAGLSAIFISCKTGKDIDNNWLYEIYSVATHYHALPVLAVSRDLNMYNLDSGIHRARKMGISVIGIETIYDDRKLLEAMKRIANREIVIGYDS